MPNLKALNLFPRHRDEPSAFTPEEENAANRAHDTAAKRVPHFWHMVPPGFDKRLEDDELDRLVWAHIERLETAKVVTEKAI